MTDLRNAIEQGHYARKQILSRDRLVAWSHARRFETAVELARAYRGRRLLDYGCGDGTFLALTMMTPDAPSLAVGAELSTDAIDDCRLRYCDEPRLQFVCVRRAGREKSYRPVRCRVLHGGLRARRRLGARARASRTPACARWNVDHQRPR